MKPSRDEIQELEEKHEKEEKSLPETRLTRIKTKNCEEDAYHSCKCGSCAPHNEVVSFHVARH